MLSNIHELRAEVVAHPWRSVAVAFGAGGCIALAGSRRPVVRAVAATLVATMLDMLRSRVKAHVAAWIDAPDPLPRDMRA